jgi:hypothetical protein
VREVRARPMQVRRRMGYGIGAFFFQVTPRSLGGFNEPRLEIASVLSSYRS